MAKSVNPGQAYRPLYHSAVAELLRVGRRRIINRCTILATRPHGARYGHAHEDDDDGGGHVSSGEVAMIMMETTITTSTTSIAATTNY